MTNSFNIANFPSSLDFLAGALYGFVEYHNVGYAGKTTLIKSIRHFMLILGRKIGTKHAYYREEI